MFCSQLTSTSLQRPRTVIVSLNFAFNQFIFSPVPQIKQKLSNNNVTGVSLRWKKQPNGTVFTKEPKPYG